MPDDLDRFVRGQEGHIDGAIRELRAGHKSGHWMWFIFPQLAGLGHSELSRYYAIASLDEARMYVAHPVLGPRLREAAEATLTNPDRTAEQLMGRIDATKLRSSITLFAAADPEAPIFRQVLERFFDGQPDPVTIELLERKVP